MRKLVILSLSLLTANTWADAPNHFTGTVYEIGSNRSKILFKLKTERTGGPERQKSKSEYSYPDGKVAVWEESFYENGELKIFNFHQEQSKEYGTVEFTKEKVKFTYNADGEEKRDEEDNAGDVITINLIAETIRKNMDTLLKGDSFKFRLAVVDRLETVGFKVFLDKEIKYDGIDAAKIILKPSSFIIAQLVDPVKMIFEKNGDRKILVSEGRLSLKLPKKEKPEKKSDWKPLDAELVLKY